MTNERNKEKERQKLIATTIVTADLNNTPTTTEDGDTPTCSDAENHLQQPRHTHNTRKECDGGAENNSQCTTTTDLQHER